MFQPSDNRVCRAVLSVSSSAAIDDPLGEHSSAAIFDERKAQSMNDRINGFQSDDLERLKKELTANPDTGKFRLRAKNRWIDGTQSLSLVSSFYGMRREFSARSTPFIQTTDAPAVLLGKDLGPTPMEELLVALAASVTMTLAYRAAVAGIQVEEIECEVEGDMNLQSIVEPAKSGEKGFDQIRLTVHVKSAASEEQLAELCTSSPVLESLKRPIPVSISVKKD
jgi:uncharacterized OsmC-like protein